MITQEELLKNVSDTFGDFDINDDIADQAFPPHWTKEIITADRKMVKFFSLQCESEIPTTKEVDTLIDNISQKYDGKIEGWLLRLGSVTIPGFEGEEPTIEEFFNENFDSKRVKPITLLISYPVIKEQL